MSSVPEAPSSLALVRNEETRPAVPRRDFSLAPNSLPEALKFAELIASSDLAPKDFRGKPANVLVAVQMGAEVGLSPMQAIQTIAVINGRPTMYGDGFLAVIQASPYYLRHEETFDPATMTATCRFWRRGNEEPFVGTFSQKDAIAAKLWTKQGPWTDYPKRMLQLRARGFAGRDAFSDALRGLALREEIEDYPVTVETIEIPAPRPMVRAAAIPAASTPPPSPEPDSAAPAASQSEPAAPPRQREPGDDDDGLDGFVGDQGAAKTPILTVKTSTFIRGGEKNGKKWEKWEVSFVDHPPFNTFSKSVHEAALSLAGKPARITIEAQGNYENLTAIEAA